MLTQLSIGRQSVFLEEVQSALKSLLSYASLLCQEVEKSIFQVGFFDANQYWASDRNIYQAKAEMQNVYFPNVSLLRNIMIRCDNISFQ